MTALGTVLFPAGTPVLVVGFTDKSWDALEAFAYNHQAMPKGVECGTLAEPFVTGGALLLDYGGSIVGIKPMPEDRVVPIESRSKERLVSIERRVPDEHGIMRYLVAKDTKTMVRDVSVSRGFMCGFEPKLRVAEEIRRIFLDLPIRTF